MEHRLLPWGCNPYHSGNNIIQNRVLSYILRCYSRDVSNALQYNNPYRILFVYILGLVLLFVLLLHTMRNIYNRKGVTYYSRAVYDGARYYTYIMEVHVLPG